MQKGVEFAAGVARHPDGKGLLISFGVGDSEAWIAMVEASDVRHLLEDVADLPCVSPKKLNVLTTPNWSPHDRQKIIQGGLAMARRMRAQSWITW
jgi:hypothetical protein